MGCTGNRCAADFYPRPPRGGRLIVQVKLQLFMQISIHALREEGDGFNLRFCRNRGNFYPRPPRGGRRFRCGSSRRCAGDFYPRPPRGGRPPCQRVHCRTSPISIHALREEGDLFAPTMVMCPPDFYPRPPRGGRPASISSMMGSKSFLSTPSARRATLFMGLFLPD